MLIDSESDLTLRSKSRGLGSSSLESRRKEKPGAAHSSELRDPEIMENSPDFQSELKTEDSPCVSPDPERDGDGDGDEDVEEDAPAEGTNGVKT